jgi:hypothetical protein
MPQIIDTTTAADGYAGEYRISDRRFGLLNKKFSIVYQVLADNASQTEDDILTTTGLPGIYTYLRGGYCVSKKAKEENTAALLWEVTCDFDSNINPTNAGETDPTSCSPSGTGPAKPNSGTWRRMSTASGSRTRPSIPTSSKPR